MIPVVGLAAVWIVRKMIEKELDALPGWTAIGALVMMFAVSLWSKNIVVSGMFILAIVTMAVVFPFAESQMSRLIGRELNADRIERAHEALAARPDNVAAWFELARTLWDHGFQGHAIAIAEGALNGLSSSADPVKNQSMRDIFRSEEFALKQWKVQVRPELNQPLACPLCHTMNEPGKPECKKCGQAYLLEIVRRGDLRGRFVSRLVMTFALVAGVIVFGAFGGVALEGSARIFALLAALALVGVVLWLSFRAPKGDRTMDGPRWT